MSRYLPEMTKQRWSIVIICKTDPFYVYIRYDSTRPVPHFEGSDRSIHQGNVTVAPIMTYAISPTADLH